MIEILSRGRISDDDEWVDGYYVCLNCKSHRIYTGFAEVDCGTYYPDFYTVDPKTIGRCTGISDKNGTKIFEGDIIKTKKYGKIVGHSNVNDYDIFAVEYEPAVFRLVNHSRGFNLVGDGTDYEVVGNIHDNPELLT